MIAKTNDPVRTTQGQASNESGIFSPLHYSAKSLSAQYLNLSDDEKAAFAEAILKPETEPIPAADPWKPLTMEDVYQPLPPVEFVADGLFERASFNILFGAPGTLKSFLLQDLAVCVATGKPWLTPAPWGEGGAAVTTHQNPVLWLDQDMGHRRTVERFAAEGRAHETPDDAPLTIFTMPNPPLNAADPLQIEALAARAEGAGFIVIDNLRTISGGIDENASQMSEVAYGLRWLAEITGAAVVVIHHQRKSNGLSGGRAGDSLRGHSSIEAALDLALQVDREPYSDAIIIKCTKARGTEVLPFAATFTYESGLDGALKTARFFSVKAEDDQSNAAVEREILAALDGVELNQTALKEEVKRRLPDVGKNRVVDMIRQMEDAGKIEALPGPKNSLVYQFPGASRSFPGS